jgi:hypothetical protein
MGRERRGPGLARLRRLYITVGECGEGKQPIQLQASLNQAKIAKTSNKLSFISLAHPEGFQMYYL